MATVRSYEKIGFINGDLKIQLILADPDLSLSSQHACYFHYMLLQPGWRNLVRLQQKKAFLLWV